MENEFNTKRFTRINQRLFLICVKRQNKSRIRKTTKKVDSLITSQNTFINQGDMKNKNTQTKFKLKFEDLKTIITNK